LVGGLIRAAGGTRPMPPDKATAARCAYAQNTTKGTGDAGDEDSQQTDGGPAVREPVAVDAARAWSRAQAHEGCFLGAAVQVRVRNRVQLLPLGCHCWSKAFRRTSRADMLSRCRRWGAVTTLRTTRQHMYIWREGRDSAYWSSHTRGTDLKQQQDTVVLGGQLAMYKLQALLWPL